MKKLEQIDFQKCDVLSQDQLNSLRGGYNESTHSDCCTQPTTCHPAGDCGYVITWDSGAKTAGMWLCDEVDPE